jgi:uncharacterized protein with von Willebrand factor type A (vWA) domain
MKRDHGPPPRRLGGVIHTYLGYDPKRFPPPAAPPADVVSPFMEHMLMFGGRRTLTEEELARAIRLDPDQIKGLGPSIDALIAMLLERKRKILERYETSKVLAEVARNYREQADRLKPPHKLSKAFDREVRAEHLRGLERLWYRVDDEQSAFARGLLHLTERLGEKYEVDELDAKYAFTGREPMSVDEAIAIKQELEEIDRLLEQLEQARETAQIAVIDLSALAEFAEPGDVEGLQALQQQVEDYLRELADQQGLEFTREGYKLTPQAMRLFQSKLLDRIFDELKASRSGRHDGPIVGEGAVEIPKTKQYEFGDSVTHMDIPQSMVNAMIRLGPDRAPGPVRMLPEDIEIHRTRNTPKCATSVIIDMSGSMRYDGLYINAKRMAIALDGLIRSEYPGDGLQFIEMYTFAKPRHVSELPELMPKPVTIHDPVVRLKADMSDEQVHELQIPPHFTNIQDSLRKARLYLGAQDTANRQVILITDGLPTAHYEDEHLFLLYPPDPRTEEATMREALACARDGITINIFLLPNWNQSHDDIQFAHRMVETTGGRVFFTAGHDLDRYVVWDYVSRRRTVIS